MAVYEFSALADGQSVAFNPSVDRLNFDQTSIAAGDLSLVMEGSSLRVNVKSGPVAGKDVLLANTSLEQIAGGINFTFADGSMVRIGDNTVGTANDAAGNGLTGGAGRDLLMGLGGNDNLQAGDNNDSVVGGAGNDAVSGNNGNDWLEGNAGIDTLNGGGGQDAFFLRDMGTANADLLADFSTGWDNVQLDAATFTQIGAAGRFVAGDARFFAGTAAHDADDRIIFNSATRQIFYDADGNGAGAAQLIGTLGTGRTVVATDFWAFGTAGGGGGGNVINGTAGDDTLIGGTGNDTINGLGGNDSLDGGEGADSMSGGDGNDTVDGHNHRTFDLDPDVDTLAGGFGNDVLMVDNSADVVVDAGGIDTVIAGNISWTLGGGFENLIIQNANDGRIDGVGNALDNVMGAAGQGWFLHFEGLGGNDTLIGSPQNDTLLGGDGNDFLDGGEDVDTLDGGAGNDTLETGFFGDDDMVGGSGSDHFAVATPGEFANRVHDFQTTVDKLRIDGNRMQNVGPTGNFAGSDPRFFAGTAAHDADDRVIWDASAGTLWYDPDGTGSATQQAVAQLQAGATVVATDIEVVNGTGGGQTINGTAGNDSLVGGPASDTMFGFAGNDTLDGGGGPDSMDGGSGNDLYIVDNLSDVIVELQNGGIDEVRTGINGYVLPDWVNNLTLTGFASSGTGNAIDNVVTGTASGSFLEGLDGNDTLIGGAGRDFMRGGTGNDSIVGGALDDFVEGNEGDDTLLGGDGADTISIHISTPGSWGSDVIDGGAGIDDLNFSFDGGGSDPATVNLANGTVSSGNGSATVANVERVFGTEGGDRVTGDAAANLLNGLGGHDTLDGGAGQDTLAGGFGTNGVDGPDTFLFTAAPGAANADLVTQFVSGSDMLRLDASVMTALGASGTFAAGDARFFAAAGANAGHDADDRVVYNTTTGELWYDADGSGGGAAQLIATLRASFSGPAAQLAATDIAVDNGSSGGGGQTINGTAGNDTLTGTPGDDTINGLGGNDSLDGGLGSDSLIGGDGNDTLVGIESGGLADQANDTLDGGLGNDVYRVRESDVILADPGGIDTVEAFNTDWTLGAGLDNLDLTDSGIAPSGTGNELDNVIRSGTEGGTLSGLGGNDLLIARHSQNTATLLGGDGNDTLDGSGESTNMNGGSGNDVLIGGGGSGSGMTGGTGADIFAFDFIGSVAAIFDFDSGTDKLRFDGTGFTQIGASGNFSANDPRFFAGTAAHDADDRIIFDAGSGNLWYDADGNGSGEQLLVADVTGNVVASDIAVVNGSSGGGGQTINGTAGNDSLVGGTGNDTINGNQGNDTLVGNAGDDSLDGGSGTDSLNGGVGNDIYVVSTGDILADAGGIDLVFSPVSWSLAGSFENLEFTGTASVGGSGNFMANRMVGNSANNFFRGREGNDTLTGGGGADSFEFVTAMGPNNVDRITDFVSGVDKIRLDDAVHAGIGATGNFASSDARFAAGAGFTSGQDASDRVIYDTTTGNLYYDSNGSAAGGSQLIATLDGAPGLAASDIGVI